MCRAQAAHTARRHGHSFRLASLSLLSLSLSLSLLLLSTRILDVPLFSSHRHHPSLPRRFTIFRLSCSLFLSPPFARAPVRIFFFNLIYRQFDGRKTRRHFCLSRYPPAGPRPLPSTPTWRGVKLLKFITPDIRRGVKTRSAPRRRGREHR